MDAMLSLAFTPQSTNGQNKQKKQIFISKTQSKKIDNDSNHDSTRFDHETTTTNAIMCATMMATTNAITHATTAVTTNVIIHACNDDNCNECNNACNNGGSNKYNDAFHSSSGNKCDNK